MDKERAKETYKTYKELIKGKSDRQLMESIALNLKRLEIDMEQNLSNLSKPLYPKPIIETKEKIVYLTPDEPEEDYGNAERMEAWNKKKEEFESIAEDISRDNDFFVLRDNPSREKWVKKNYPNQKDVKYLVQRAVDLHLTRLKKFSI
jgi:hypothetical protein